MGRFTAASTFDCPIYGVVEIKGAMHINAGGTGLSAGPLYPPRKEEVLGLG